MKPILWLFLVCVAGCSVGDEIRELEAEYPAARVRLVEYGPSRQDVWVVLAEGVSLASVMDLAVFHPLEPRTTAEGATHLLGNPASRQIVDDTDQWFRWQGSRAIVEVGCARGSSIPGGPCVWQLHAWLVSGEPVNVLHPVLQSYVRRTRDSSPAVVHRTLYVEEAGGLKESFVLTLDHPGEVKGRMRWDRSRPIEPSNQPLQPTRGGKF